jgi:short-subunit dehydrogenase
MIHIFNIFCYYLGVLILFIYIIKIIRWIYKYFILKFNINELKEKYGDGWVIITGGSSGIGFSFAEQFVKNKYKILLISSNEQNLIKAKNELEKKYPNLNKIEILPFDLSIDLTNKKNYDNLDKKISEKIKGEEIAILFNNAGVITRKIFHNFSNDEIKNMLNVNVISVVYLTKIILNYMLKKTKKSLVIGSGSVMGRMRIKTRSIYSSTKSFLESFNETLNSEYKDKIDFTTLEIGSTASNMVNFKLPLMIDSNSLSESSMKFLGKYNFTTGHIKHEIMRIIFWKIPFVKNIIRNSKKQFDH